MELQREIGSPKPIYHAALVMPTPILECTLSRWASLQLCIYGIAKRTVDDSTSRRGAC